MKHIFFFVVLFSCIALAQQKPSDDFAATVKKEFLRSWHDYEKIAWGHDDLKPLSKGYADWYKQPLFISPIDAYSTMKLMGYNKEAVKIERYIIDSINFNKDIFVKTFEMNIRVLGGLLDMYELTKDKRILQKAEDFGKRLLPAFGTKTGIPRYWVNLKTGESKGDTVNMAEAATNLIELGVLSYYTKDPVYYQAAKKAVRAVYQRRSPIGLVGESINASTGEWTDTVSHIGCCIDSYYEYLYKAYVLFHDEELKDMWDNSLRAIDKYLAEEKNGRLWYGRAGMNSGTIVSGEVTLYDAYFPAVLVLTGDIKRADKAFASWDWLWKLNHAEPMVYDYRKDTVTDAMYDLNPEIVESAYYLLEYTGKEKYRDMAKEYFADIMKYCKYDIGFTSLKDIRTKERGNSMPTFFFAETMKYLYLAAGGAPKFHLKDYVFNTEAHPFKKNMFNKKEIKKRLGL